MRLSSLILPVVFLACACSRSHEGEREGLSHLPGYEEVRPGYRAHLMRPGDGEVVRFEYTEEGLVFMGLGPEFLSSRNTDAILMLMAPDSGAIRICLSDGGAGGIYDILVGQIPPVVVEVSSGPIQ